MTFSLPEFLPYLLNQAAERVGREFESHYRTCYGMLRTEWRVLFHLGLHGDMPARRICEIASIHKTKVSRAVTALENKCYLTRRTDERDRRVEHLSLTGLGRAVFLELREAAERYEASIAADLTEDEIRRLRVTLLKLIRH